MPRITYLLDTSAILAHYFDESGAAEVDFLWEDPTNRVAICVLSIPELLIRLKQEVGELAEVERVFNLYINQLTVSLVVDRAVAEQAAQLREIVPDRLPLVDACIAACAQRHSCTLVHRDPHMDQMPPDSPVILRLPDR